MVRPLRIGFKTAPTRVSWDQVRAIWQRAGELGAFESAWLFDHFYPVDGDGSCFEGLTALAAGLVQPLSATIAAASRHTTAMPPRTRPSTGRT